MDTSKSPCESMQIDRNFNSDGLTYFLVEGDDYTILRYLKSPFGSQCAVKAILLFYEKVFKKETKTGMTKELWRHAIKEACRAIARDWWRPFGRRMAGDLKKVIYRIYRYFWAGGRVPEGVFIFADLERMSDESLAKALLIWKSITESKSAAQALNSPADSMRRYDVLRTLYEQGINTFNAYRWSEGERPGRFPVFLRYENDHRGPISPLIHSEQELDEALRDLEARGQLSKHLLIIEFRDTSDQSGIYRKYGALIVGDSIFPRNLNFSDQWVVKHSHESLSNGEFIAEEKAYVDENPHVEALKRIFALTKIQYGRIDYSMFNGTIQVWEINTNPHITTEGPERIGPRKRVYDLAEQRFFSALKAMASNR
jgi:hypothetical protein